MNTTRISRTGQVTIPRSIRENLGWKAGQELIIIQVEKGVLLKPKNPFPPSQLEDVAGSLAYAGAPVTTEEMDMAVGKGLAETKEVAFEN